MAEFLSRMLTLRVVLSPIVMTSLVVLALMSCVWMETELRFMLIQFVSLLVENSVTFLSLLLGDESVLLSFVCFMCRSL